MAVGAYLSSSLRRCLEIRRLISEKERAWSNSYKNHRHGSEDPSVIVRYRDISRHSKKVLEMFRLIMLRITRFVLSR